MSTLDDVLDHVDASLAFDPGYYNESYLSRRVDSRMRRRNADDYGTYLDILEDDDGEREELLNALTINVTSFFRNPDVWESLVPVLRDLTDEKRRVRCWSSACADGREPYSLAMAALDDDDVRERAVEIEATDISRPALESAREGAYKQTRTTDLDAELEPLDDPSEYVDVDGETLRVTDRVKRLVDFDEHDLVVDGPRSREGMDLVLCRNILIYIDSEHKERVFESLAGSLRRGGYLVLGKTETLPPGFRDAFDAVDKRCRIYRKR